MVWATLFLNYVLCKRNVNYAFSSYKQSLLCTLAIKMIIIVIMMILIIVVIITMIIVVNLRKNNAKHDFLQNV